MGKGSFILYDSDMEGVLLLTQYQAGMLFTGLIRYRLHGEKPDFGNNVAVSILFNQIVNHIAINEEKYKAACEKKSEAMKKRWNEKKTIEEDSTLCSTIEKGCLLSDNDNVNDNDNDNVTDTVTVTDACGAKRENKEKNYYDRKNNVPNLLRDNPSYDIDAFMRKSIEIYRNAAKQSDQQ